MRYKATHLTNRELAEFVTRRQQDGASLVIVAAELGVSRETLRKWGFRPMRVTYVCPQCGGRRSKSSVVCQECSRTQQRGIRGDSAFCSRCLRWLPLERFYRRTDPRFVRPVRAHCKECESKDVVNRYRKDPRKGRARRQVYLAVKSGKLKRQPCAVCGATTVHAHHRDYDRPLDVEWLCPSHHQRVCPSC